MAHRLTWEADAWTMTVQCDAGMDTLAKAMGPQVRDQHFVQKGVAAGSKSSEKVIVHEEE